MLASTAMRPVTPHTLAISSTTSTASSSDRPRAAESGGHGHAGEPGPLQGVDVVPRVLLAAVHLGRPGRYHLAGQGLGLSLEGALLLGELPAHTSTPADWRVNEIRSRWAMLPPIQRVDRPRPSTTPAKPSVSPAA